MVNNWRQELPTFDPYSYYAGVTSAFAEVVAAGVKPLALSQPYTHDELAVMAAPSRQIAAEYGLTTWVEDDLLVTPLFPAAIAREKHVIFILRDDPVLQQYKTLKRDRNEALAAGRLEAVERDLARRFGRLLGYSAERIEAMLDPV